mgnify:CR=1 FL=1
MKESRELKRLNTLLNLTSQDAEAAKLQLTNAKDKYDKLLKEQQRLESQIANLKRDKKLIVTEHALLRYCERVLGINLKEVEAEILSPEIIELVEKLGGTGQYPNRDFKVVIKDFVITTVL